MLFIQNTCTQSGWNLALEEYLLTEFRDDILMLWRNERAVIIGRNQNALEEINEPFTREHHISVTRRLTGGGAVFHDLGNINFSFMQSAEQASLGDFHRFLTPICDFLQELGVRAYQTGRNDLEIDGKKISGNAQTIQNGRLLHHGTLLFQVDLGEMKGALNPPSEKLESKGIRSVQSRVTNLSAYLPASMTPDDFLTRLSAFLLDHIPGLQAYALSQQDILAVNRLASSKYNTWEWNFGASPDYTLKQARRFPFGIVDVRLTIQQGIITAAAFYGDFFGVAETGGLVQRLIGCRHNAEALHQALEGVPLDTFISGMQKDELISLLL